MKYIVTADIHLRSTQPICRTDDWESFQTQRFRAIFEAAKEHGCNGVVIVGDLFDTPNPSEKILHLVLTTISEFGIMTVVMVGNHDVPYHALQHLGDTKAALLAYHPLVKFIKPDNNFIGVFDGMRLIHQLTFERREDIPPTVKAHTAVDWLDKFDEDIILCGDMHRPFKLGNTSDDRIVINCGHTACQKVSERYESGVWLVDTEEVTAEYLQFPDDLGNVSTDHLEEKIEKSNRFSNLVSTINEQNNEVKELDFMAVVKSKCDALDNGSEVFGIIVDTIERS